LFNSVFHNAESALRYGIEESLGQVSLPMLATSQSGSDFKALNDVAKRKTRELLANVPVDTRELKLSAAPAAQFRTLPSDCIALVEHGLVSVLHDTTVVSVLDAGDLILPDTDFLPNASSPLHFGSEAGATLKLYPRMALLDYLRADRETSLLWDEVCTLQVSLQLRLNALHIREAVGMGGAPEVYPAGAVIIQQGDPADDIFSMTDGLAEVTVNDMPVAKIRPGELFGTMAALTGGHRNATVRAVEACSIVRVPRDRFFELIRSRPAAIQGLLVDMAKSITELNEEVVTLRRRNLEH
jgi:CRP-like cAMP-binding protein